jgi:hypothetical protein
MSGRDKYMGADELKRQAVKRFFATPEPDYTSGLREVRCPDPCGKMLGEFAGAGKIVCPRCGRMVKWE